MALTSARRLVELLTDVADDRPPRYVALASRVRLLVSDGRLPVGTQLPAERDLAVALGLSRTTVSAAYARLREDGWADARQGAGTWTVLPTGRSHPPWAPSAPGSGLDLVHAAPSAPPEVAAAFSSALAELPRALSSHGYVPGGLPELRQLIAQRYTARGLPTTAAHVLITGGALAALSLVVDELLRRGDRLLVEHPTYPNALDLARHRGLRVVPVAVPDDDPAGFVDAVNRTAAELRPAAAYLMPDFSNPAGQLLGTDHRRRLASGLRRAGTIAVVDETLVDLDLDPVGAPAAPYALFDPGAITLGTLSKAVWGGLRIGWLRAEPDVIRRLSSAATRSQLSLPVVEQLAACHLLGAPEEVLAGRRNARRHRRDVLRAALQHHLPHWDVPCPDGGLVLWCGVPSGRSSAIAVAAERAGLLLAAGPRFGTGHAFEDRMRLPFTLPEPELLRAVGLLAAADAEATSTRQAAAPSARTALATPLI